MKKRTIFSLVVGILLLTANVSFARDGSKIPKTEVIPKVFTNSASEQPAIMINLAVAQDAIVVDVSPATHYAVYAATSISDASSGMVQERLSPAEVPRLCDPTRITDLENTTLQFAPPNTKIKDYRRSNIQMSEGYQVKKE